MHDRAWRDYTERFRRDVLPQLLESAAMIHIGGENRPGRTLDLRAATEVGLALLLGKPLLIVVPRGETIPVGLRRAADEIIEEWDPDDGASQDRLAAAMCQIMEEQADG